MKILRHHKTEYTNLDLFEGDWHTLVDWQAVFRRGRALGMPKYQDLETTVKGLVSN